MKDILENFLIRKNMEVILRKEWVYDKKTLQSYELGGY